MRKLISIIIVFMLLISIFSVNTQAVLRMKKGNVSYGTPAIDGIMDDCYKNSSALAIEFMSSMANNATEDDLPDMAKGNIWLCWDENALYFYLEVADRTPVTQPIEGFSSDAAELMFDFDSLGDGTYGDNGLFIKTLAYARAVGTPEYEVDWPDIGSGHQIWLSELPESERELICVIKPDGYVIERKIPLNDAVKAMMKPGFTFGFQISLLDDIDDNSQRDFKVAWGESTGDVDVANWGNSDSCDELVLTEAPPPPEEPEAAEVIDETPVAPVVVPPTPSAPPTGDATVLFSLASLLGAGGLSVLKTRKRK